MHPNLSKDINTVFSILIVKNSSLLGRLTLGHATPADHRPPWTVSFVTQCLMPAQGRLAMVMVVDSGPSIRYMTKDRCQA